MLIPEWAKLSGVSISHTHPGIKRKGLLFAPHKLHYQRFFGMKPVFGFIKNG